MQEVEELRSQLAPGIHGSAGVFCLWLWVHQLVPDHTGTASGIDAECKHLRRQVEVLKELLRETRCSLRGRWSNRALLLLSCFVDGKEYGLQAAGHPDAPSGGITVDFQVLRPEGRLVIATLRS